MNPSPGSSSSPPFPNTKPYSDPSLASYDKMANSQTSPPTSTADTTTNNSSEVFQPFFPNFVDRQTQSPPPPPPTIQPTLPPVTPSPEKSTNNDREPNSEKKSDLDEVVLFFGNSSVAAGFFPRQGHFINCNFWQLKRMSLPLTELALHLATCFFRNGHQQIPIFHEATIMRRLSENKVSPFLVYALCAAGAR